MRLEMKSTQDGIETYRKKNPICITFKCGRNEMKFCFAECSKKKADSAKTSHSCFDEINACADVSFRMISIWLVFT